MTQTRPLSFYFASALLALGAGLAAVNWYVQPERALAWGSAIAALAVFAVTWAGMTLVFRRVKDDAARVRAGDAIRNGIVFAALIIVVTLSAKLAATLGAVDAGFSQRATMVVMGLFFAFTGNALPKTLTPLSAMQCDGSRMQAFQRFAGWTWTLTGIAFAIVWLVLPVGVAKPVSLVLLMSGMLIVAAQVVRLRWPRRGTV